MNKNMKSQSIFAIVLVSMLFALASCEDPSVKDMQDRYDQRIQELEDRLAAMESGGSQNSGSNPSQNDPSQNDPSQNDPSGNNPSGTTPSGNQSGATVSGSVGGHDYVDLGLPSGTLWATCNVGADSPEEYGDYFAWGETTPKSDYSWSTYKYGTAEYQLTKYCDNSDYGKNGFTDNKTVLDAEDDAATANWGNGWRMPTGEELAELKDGCIKIWTTQQGVKGRIFIGLNGNTLFLPAAGYYIDTSLDDAGSYGYYWLSTLYDYDPNGAYCLSFSSGYVYWDGYYRYYGLSVRPVVKR